MEKKAGPSSSKVVLTIKDGDKTKQEISFDSVYEFRILWFSEDGHSGTMGRLPLVAIEPMLEGAAAEWASGLSPESISRLESSLREQYPSLSLLSLLQLLDQDEAMCLLENYYREQCGPEDGPVACKIICAQFKALRSRLEKEEQASSPEGPPHLLNKEASAAIINVLAAMFRTESTQEVR